MPKNADLHARSLHGFDVVVRQIRGDEWEAPSACNGWSARAVVGHVIGVQRYIESLAAAHPATIDPYGDPAAIAGADPVETWNVALGDVLRSLEPPEVVTRVVVTFRGTETLDAQLGWNVVDTLAHTWDLARTAAIDLDVDGEVLGHAIAEAASIPDAMREPPFFGPALAVPVDAEPLEQFLALVGRDPRHR